MNWKDSVRQNHGLISDTFPAIFLGMLKKITQKKKKVLERLAEIWNHFFLDMKQEYLTLSYDDWCYVVG